MKQELGPRGALLEGTVIALEALTTEQLAIGQVATAPYSFPTAIIAVLVGLLIAGMMRLFDLDWPIAILLLLGIWND